MFREDDFIIIVGEDVLGQVRRRVRRRVIVSSWEGRSAPVIAWMSQTKTEIGRWM